MPRKKAATATVPGETPAVSFQGECPACKSKITVNHHGNAVLHEKSAYLEELLETDAGVDEVEKNIGALEKKLGERDATIADLRAKLDGLLKREFEAKSKPAAPAPQKETANVGQEQKRKSWYD